MAHIFISYSKQNIDFARHLRTLLENAGFSVWMDEAQLIASERWWPTIEQSISGCSAFVIIMSPESKSSDWVEREILFAERLRKPIFPVLLAGESWPRLANIQFADMRAGRDARLPADLLTGLRRAMAAPGTAPAPQYRAASPPRRRNKSLSSVLLIGSGLVFVLIIAALGLTALSPGGFSVLQAAPTSDASSLATAAAEQTVARAAFLATQQENTLRNAATQTANAPASFSPCSPETWFFTFSPGIEDASPCPEAAIFVAATRQDFEGGFMLWYASTSQHILFPDVVDDVPQVYVIFNEERQPFEIYNDVWTTADPSSDPELVPPEGRYQPVDRLGKIWREQPGVRDRLGWAVAPEQAVGGRYQLPQGFMCNCVRTFIADGQGNVLEVVQGLTLAGSIASGSWQQVGTYPFQ